MNQVQDVVLNEGGQQRGARRQAGRVRLLRPRLPGELRQQWQQLQVSVQIYPYVKVTKYREEDVPSGQKCEAKTASNQMDHLIMFVVSHRI